MDFASGAFQFHEMLKGPPGDCRGDGCSCENVCNFRPGTCYFLKDPGCWPPTESHPFIRHSRQGLLTDLFVKLDLGEISPEDPRPLGGNAVFSVAPFCPVGIA